jgi:hypothetical protein
MTLVEHIYRLPAALLAEDALNGKALIGLSTG